MEQNTRVNKDKPLEFIVLDALKAAISKLKLAKEKEIEEVKK